MMKSYYNSTTSLIPILTIFRRWVALTYHQLIDQQIRSRHHSLYCFCPTCWWWEYSTERFTKMLFFQNSFLLTCFWFRYFLSKNKWKPLPKKWGQNHIKCYYNRWKYYSKFLMLNLFFSALAFTEKGCFLWWQSCGSESLWWGFSTL